MSHDSYPRISGPKNLEVFNQLKGKLLAIGGDDVCNVKNKHIALITRFGELMDARRSRKVRGVPRNCEFNSVMYYLEGRVKLRFSYKVASGYALNHGCWRPHYWVVDRGRILETTCEREAYFGVILDEVEVCGLAIDCVGYFMPGYDRLSELYDKTSVKT